MVNAAREHGVSPATIHRWKSKYGGMTLSELKRLKALEEENARLKRIVAQQVLDIVLHSFKTNQMASCINKCKQLSARVFVQNVGTTLRA